MEAIMIDRDEISIQIIGEVALSGFLSFFK
jgi:hypothetical protein